MPDFSGASLKLKAEGEEKVLATLDRIDKKAKESVQGFARLSQDEVDKAAAAFDRLYGKQSRSARQTQAVVEDVAKKVDATVGSMSHSAALGLGELGRGFARVAESGNLGAFAVREFTGAAFRLGGALGTAGLGTGIGLAVIAIGGLVEYFESAKKKADELADSYQKDLEKIAHASSLLQASQAEQEAFSGDPLAALTGKRREETDAQFLARTKGLQGLRDEAERLNTVIDKAKNNPIFSGGTGAGGRQIGVETLRNQLKEVNEQIGILGQRWSIANEALRRLNATEQDAARIALEAKQERQKHIPEFGTTDPYRREENAAINLRPDALTLEMARLAAQIPDPIKEFGDKLNADQAANMFQIHATLEAQLKNAFKPIDDAKRDAEQKAQQIGAAITSGITSGISAAFAKGGSISQGFKALTQSVLQGLGDMFAAIAEKALIASAFMQKIVTFLTTNPWLAAAAAAAMLAFASSMGGRAGGGSSSSASYAGGYTSTGSTIIDRGIINPANNVVTSPNTITPRDSNVYNITLIGKDDARAQRDLLDMVTTAQRRRGDA